MRGIHQPAFHSPRSSTRQFTPGPHYLVRHVGARDVYEKEDVLGSVRERDDAGCSVHSQPTAEPDGHAGDSNKGFFARPEEQEVGAIRKQKGGVQHQKPGEIHCRKQVHRGEALFEEV